jgi:hypothetical protein
MSVIDPQFLAGLAIGVHFIRRARRWPEKG